MIATNDRATAHNERATAMRLLAQRRMQIFGLSQADRRVAEYLLDGAMNKEIAVLLGCSIFTVKSRITAINRKLGTGDRLQIVLRLLGLF